ncbi:MAG: hypothetical protein JW955_17110 [Sedimentisphaerales bacterium]|nr:hypothetical protein [Sedimentisphaerales bacterium]
MWFLWIFGNAVCAKIGSIAYLPVYIFLGVSNASTLLDLQVRIAGPEVLEHDDGIGHRRIRDRHAFFGRSLGDEELVECELAVADHRGRLDIPDAEGAVALHHDEAVGAAVLDRHRRTRLDGQLLGTEGVGLVADPVLDEALLGHFLRRVRRPGPHEAVLDEIRIDIEIPIDDAEQPIHVALPVLRRVFPQQFFGHDLVVGDVLVHGEDVRGLLRLVRAQAPRGVKDTRRHVPPGPDIESISGSQRRDGVVSAFGGVQQCLADLVSGHARIETEEGVGKIAAVIVDLGREEVRLGLAELPGELGVSVAMVNMVRQRALVVEEFRVHGPATVLSPNPLTDDLAL